jgi:hypothetical protein
VRSSDIEILESMPSFISFRKSALKVNGGELESLYDMSNEDGRGESRARSGHNCRKDHASRNEIAVKRARDQVRALLGK